MKDSVVASALGFLVISKLVDRRHRPDAGAGDVRLDIASDEIRVLLGPDWAPDLLQLAADSDRTYCNVYGLWSETVDLEICRSR